MTPEQTAEQMIFVTPVLNEWAVCIKEKDNSWELSAVDTKDFADRLANIYRGVIARAMKQAVAAERARVTHELTHCHKCEASLPVTSRCGECGQDQMLEDED